MRKKVIDYALLVVFIFLLIVGFLVLASASSDLGKIENGDAYFYIKHQLTNGFSFGFIGFFLALYIPYEYWKKSALPLLVVNLVAVLLVFTPLGFHAGGADRWLALGPLTVQPMEFLKLTFIMYLAAWLSNNSILRSKIISVGLVPFWAICGAVSLLLIIQKSTSTIAVLMLAALFIYFAAGAKWRFVLSTILLGLLLFAIITAATPYRRERILTFFDPHRDISGASYQINQSKITIGSGGLLGVGYGKSITKSYLPERIGDFIFAVMAEEFGFLGSMLVMGGFFFVIMRGYLLSRKIRDPFAKLLMIGFASVIGIQVFLHIGSNTGMLPTTGIALPFISYGGSALMVFMTMIGIMLNVSKEA